MYACNVCVCVCVCVCVVGGGEREVVGSNVREFGFTQEGLFAQERTLPN